MPQAPRGQLRGGSRRIGSQKRAAVYACVVGVVCACALRASPASPLAVSVEAEETVYQYEPADNGAGPLWCSGSSCLVRIGQDIIASGLETITNAKPLNNCRWLLFQRTSDGWTLRARDATGRTREPCPLAAFPDGRLFLSDNPTLTPPDTYSGPARPEILQFAASNLNVGFERLLPAWAGTPTFTEHSYRSFAADAARRELILLQNIGYTHAEWTFRTPEGNWSAGKLVWPMGTNYAKPQPIRVCYPDVALNNRAVHFCGVSDIVEPNPEWRAYKKQLTGREWDYDFRRLFYTWTPDITKTGFHEWIEIASRESTCGWISPGDLWLAPDGVVHIVWTERALDERLRQKFFPIAKQSHSLEYAQLREGKVAVRRTLLLREERKPGVTASNPRFQITPDRKLYVVLYAEGTGDNGKTVSENRVMQLDPAGRVIAMGAVPLQTPFTAFFTATVRAGSEPSHLLELLGQRAGRPKEIAYARVKLP